MGVWKEEYEENGWKEYVEQVLAERFGDTTNYQVTEEDARQMEHVMNILDEDDSAEESFEYHTPRSDISFEYCTPGPQKKRLRQSSIGSTSFFPEFDSQELKVEENASDKISINLCERLANLSPITSQQPPAIKAEDCEDQGIQKSLTYEMEVGDTLASVDMNKDGEMVIDESDIKKTLEHEMEEKETSIVHFDEVDGKSQSTLLDDSVEIADTLHAQSNYEYSNPMDAPEPDFIDVDMSNQEEFDELEIQPEEMEDNMDWTMLLDHFDVDLPEEDLPNEDVSPTQRKQFDEEFDFSSQEVEKPRRRRLIVPADDQSSVVSFRGDSQTSIQDDMDTIPQRFRYQATPPTPGSEISSIDDVETLLSATQPYTTVESTKPLHLAHVSSNKPPLKLEIHQEQAVTWMQERERPDAKPFRGGILADEMGLGKTICCLALISARMNESVNTKKKRPTLIITPLSLVHQWEQEIKDKTTLSVGLYHGTNRKRFQRSQEFYAFDIIMTTYDTLRLKEATFARPTAKNDQMPNASRWINSKRSRETKQLASKLHKVYWERVILDEAHLISNSVSARAQAACQLSGRARWCVTGTPIQNRLEDVHTLLQFLGLPAVENESHLHTLLNQCMLRRLKSTLARPLPSKVEQLIKLTFQTEAERNWYAAVRQTTREQVQQHIQERRPARHIFELLLRLRQVCNSPLLLPESENNHGNSMGLPVVHISTKMQVLFDHLRRAKEEMAPVLVISQWTHFLDLLEEQLSITNPSTRCARLDGRMSAANRHAVVQRFQSNSSLAGSSNSIDVLLMSLRCGGLGLNLTKARYVFLMEPCWNPSLEAQAIDRTHRLGQKHVVQVFRFLMENTIEEKIYELQQLKRNLATTILNEHSSGGTKKPSSRQRRTTNDWVALMAA